MPGICPRGPRDAAEEAGRARAAPSRPGRRCGAAGAAGALMRPPPGGRTRRRGLSLGVLALCVAAARCLQSKRGPGRAGRGADCPGWGSRPPAGGAGRGLEREAAPGAIGAESRRGRAGCPWTLRLCVLYSFFLE